VVLIAALALWIALSVAAHRALTKAGRATVPIMAGVMALGLAVTGLIRLAQSQRVPDTNGYADTYYVVSQGHFLLNCAIFYLVAAGFVLLIRGMARGWIKRLHVPAFWVYHLGTAAVVLPTLLARFYIPKRYVDSPGALSWLGLMSGLGAQVSVLGLIALLALAVIALSQRVVKGRTT
jgi:heme/copper-type cytochrome/quinol oxidase subunit 1